MKTLDIPQFTGRDEILEAQKEFSELLGRAVLLLPANRAEPPARTDALPRFHGKDREGRSKKQTLRAFSRAAFDAAGALGISLTHKEAHAGAHITQLPGGAYHADLMSPNPNDVARAVRLGGGGYIYLIDGRGAQGEGFDHVLGGEPGIYRLPNRRPAVLGVGVIALDDLSSPLRLVARPDLEHYQTPLPIGA